MYWHIFDEGDDPRDEVKEMRRYLAQQNFTVSTELASRLNRIVRCADPVLSVYALDRLPSDTRWGAQHYNSSSSYQLYMDLSDAPVLVWICGVVCNVHLCDAWHGSPVHNASINIRPVVQRASRKGKTFLREHSNPAIDSLLNGWGDDIRVSRWTSDMKTCPPIVPEEQPNAFLDVFDGRQQMTDPSAMRRLTPVNIGVGDLVLVQAKIVRFRPKTVSFRVSAGSIVDGPLRLPAYRLLDHSRPPYICDIGNVSACSYWDSWVSMLELEKVILLRKDAGEDAIGVDTVRDNGVEEGCREYNTIEIAVLHVAKGTQFRRVVDSRQRVKRETSRTSEAENMVALQVVVNHAVARSRIERKLLWTCVTRISPHRGELRDSEVWMYSMEVEGKEERLLTPPPSTFFLPKEGECGGNEPRYHKHYSGEDTCDLVSFFICKLSGRIYLTQSCRGCFRLLRRSNVQFRCAITKRVDSLDRYNVDFNSRVFGYYAVSTLLLLSKPIGVSG
ncbi:hypothetical protein BD410DRAFT_805780 [Rickenella mellea]|uniref:Uncharacterized protein n=1 Tax=Rickenella mellea TaxID=50990 RepID=A0A4Y7PWB2_9AGAM|nr:hypothetical protein BD410DRAFT_805780 [Rickenella mellea]